MTNFYLPNYGRRNPYFETLLKEGTNTSPIGAHSQGLSRLAFALLAGLERGQMDRDERNLTAGSPMLSRSPAQSLPDGLGVFRDNKLR